MTLRGIIYVLLFTICFTGITVGLVALISAYAPNSSGDVSWEMKTDGARDKIIYDELRAIREALENLKDESRN